MLICLCELSVDGLTPNIDLTMASDEDKKLDSRITSHYWLVQYHAICVLLLWSDVTGFNVRSFFFPVESMDLAGVTTPAIAIWVARECSKKHSPGDMRAGWWFGGHFLFSHILGMSSSQFTNSYFSEGWPNHQPESPGEYGGCVGFYVNPRWFSCRVRSAVA